MTDQQPDARDAQLSPSVPGQTTRLPPDYLEPISDVSAFEEPEATRGSIGRTMFDMSGA